MVEGDEQPIVVVDRDLTKGSEGEGITVLETADGAVFHAIDMGPLFINAFIRSYAPVEEG